MNKKTIVSIAIYFIFSNVFSHENSSQKFYISNCIILNRTHKEQYIAIQLLNNLNILF